MYMYVTIMKKKAMNLRVRGLRWEGLKGGNGGEKVIQFISIKIYLKKLMLRGWKWLSG